MNLVIALVIAVVMGVGINSIEAAGEERAKAPIISIEPSATPFPVPEKGTFEAGPWQPVPLSATVSESPLSGLSEGGNDGREHSHSNNPGGDPRGGAGLPGRSAEQITSALPGLLACFKLDAATPLFCVPGSSPQWGAEALAVGMCESGLRPEAVGAAQEKGVLQVHPVHFPAMVKLGLDPNSEQDRFTYAFRLHERSGWSPWACREQAVGIVVAKGE